jgi:hypothetical protein
MCAHFHHAFYYVGCLALYIRGCLMIPPMANDAKDRGGFSW